MKKINKEEIAEDYCFQCKDGGHLIICDYKSCLKSYHLECIGKDDSFLEAAERWNCGWHTCFICQRTSKFHCYCCPKGLCGCCINVAQFAHVQGDKGFCSHCLKLALLVEEKKDVDSDGGKVDFNDRDTLEFLFKEYWEIIREQEGLDVTNLRTAHLLLKKNQNFKAEFDDDEIEKDGSESLQMVSDYDAADDSGEQTPLSRRKRSGDQRSKGQKFVKEKKVRKEFIGWGSRPLREFLASIGKDTNTKLSQYDVTSIINEYIHENKLFHPEKKKMVVCDARLLTVLGRRSLNKNKIHDLLEVHFAENLVESEDELGYSSDDMNVNSGARKRPRVSNPNRKSQNDKAVLCSPKSCFASLVVENIKLVYLKRSLVVQLLKQPDTFEEKLIGSFVRIKSDPNDYMQRNSHQLVQVIGVKKSPNLNEANAEVLLQSTNVPTDIRICTLSEDEFSEDECKDLGRRVKDGLLKRPTVVEFELKARSLHEDIMKHWITRELALLQNLIDQANEKGWRRELFEYIERRRLLQTSEEQLRLLQEVPKVVADLPERDPVSEEILENTDQWYDDPPESDKINSRAITNKSKGSGANACAEDATVSEGKHHQVAFSIPEKNNKHQQLYISVPNEQPATILQRKLHQTGSDFAGMKQHQPTKPEKVSVKDKKAFAVQLIELSDDDQEDSKAETEPHKNVDMDSFIWYCIGPRGDKKGPLSLSILNRWIDCSIQAPNYKVWKMGESEENAILLTEVISGTPHRNRRKEMH